MFQSLQPLNAKYYVSTDTLLTVESGTEIVVERVETLTHKTQP